jgi:hypothetical protein
MPDRRAWSAAPLGWDYFDEAVYEYAQECALREFTQQGPRAPAGYCWGLTGTCPPSLRASIGMCLMAVVWIH